MERSQWDVVNPHQKQEKAIRNARYFLSALFAFVGITLLLSQLLPLTTSYINGQIPEIRESLRTSPLPEEYKTQIQEDKIYDPGTSYFQNLLQETGLSYQQDTLSFDPSTDSYKPVVINDNYSKALKLTITSAGINSIHITPNVNSYSKEVYNRSLKNGLAHFKGTPLPGDGGNSFIYGHSTIQSFFSTNPNNPEIAFSKLEKTEIGDKVEIEKENQILEYTVRKIKKVSPSDFSVLKPQGSKETVTLMTCWPLGIGTKRLLVIAEKNE